MKALVAIPPKSSGSALARVALHLAREKGYRHQAAANAIAQGESSTVVELIKSGVAPGLVADSDYTSLASAHLASTAFLSSLANQSVFYALLELAARVPFQTRVISIAQDIAAASVGEAMPTPLGGFALDSNQGLARHSLMAMIALSRELVDGSSQLAEAFIDLELRKAVAKAADAKFFALALAGAPSNASTGPDADDAIADLRMMIEDVEPAASSQLVLAVAPDVARRAAFLATLTGFLFEKMTIAGGEIRGISVMPSDGLAAGRAVLIDAARLALAADLVTVDATEQAAVEMNTSPTQNPLAPGTGASLVSLWQNNLVGVRAGTCIGAGKADANAVALLTGVAWGGALPES